MRPEEIFNKMKEAVILGDTKEALKWTREAVDKGVDPRDAIEKGLVEGIKEIGARWDREEIYLPEIVIAADTFKKGAAILDRELMRMGKTRESLGKILLGTVEGDIHDLGKNIVGTYLTAAGFDVYDLGVDVPTETFVKKVEELKPHIIGLSALCSFTMPMQKKIIDALKEVGLRDKAKVIVGGCSATQEWADEIGADAFGEDVFDALEKVKKLLGKSNSSKITKVF